MTKGSAMGEITERLHHELDAEIERLKSSADPVGSDEPELGSYAARLRSLHDAVVVQERGETR
ncbi:hypothetical protein [Nocardioides halotolerans]|uniref:hypothetical protein n=1 Tax=Nocardioides halotolerans TaxID=433660 RepID=UPI00146F1EC4|nr:hypothetical protein [Nocardioides halotolerans]